jgi:hypothetical protein
VKRIVLTLSAAVLGLAISGASFAQGRHDERPHGSMKPSAESAARAPVTSGRHDEGPYAHSPRRPAEKKPEGQADAAARPSADGDACCSK